MKKIILCLLLSWGCQPSDISPDAIESFEYSYLLGFTGSVTTIRVTQQETTLQLGYYKPKICTNPTSPQEWQDLIAVTRIQEFRDYKSVTEIGCCDRSAEGIIIRGNGRTYSAKNEFLPRDSTSIGKLAARLRLRMNERSKTCQ